MITGNISGLGGGAMTGGLALLKGASYVTYSDESLRLYKFGSALLFGQFEDNLDIRDVYIDDSVSSMAPNVFKNSGLASISNWGSLVQVMNYGFYGTQIQGDFVIPKQIQYIQNFAFYSIFIDSLSFEDGSNIFGVYDSAFSQCFFLSQVTLPDGLKEIGKNCFDTCPNLTTIVIPASVDWIKDEAFYGCSALTSVDWPAAATIMYPGTFKNCSGLAAFVVPEAVTEIQSSAFENCSALASVDFGNILTSAVTKLGSWAFYSCPLLEEFVLPDALNDLGFATFDTSAAKTIWTKGDFGAAEFTNAVATGAGDGTQKVYVSDATNRAAFEAQATTDGTPGYLKGWQILDWTNHPSPTP